MFRTHLAIVLLVLFLFVLFSGIALYWLSSQVSRNDRNSQKSFEAFDQYQELSQEAHHYFKQRMERLYRIDAQADSDSEPSNAELEEAMRKLRDVVLATPV
ncbi:MAG: sensor histidine kinase, partial [Gammaproteobacteria bacterium]